MIQVEVKYHNANDTRTRNLPDYFIYTDFVVTGHASDGTINSIKCCAGVTAILYGIRRLVSGVYDTLTINKGEFQYHFFGKDYRAERDTMYAMNTILCQLYDVYLCYPNLFSKFEMIDTSKGGKNDGEKSNN